MYAFIDKVVNKFKNLPIIDKIMRKYIHLYDY